MRPLLFPGVPNQPLPKTYPVRLYLEELESRCLLSASHVLPVVAVQPTPVVAFNAPMINPSNINPGQNFVVPMNNPGAQRPEHQRRAEQRRQPEFPGQHSGQLEQPGERVQQRGQSDQPSEQLDQQQLAGRDGQPKQYPAVGGLLLPRRLR